MPIPSSDEIRQILVTRIDHQQQSLGIVVGVTEADGRRVVAHGQFAKDNPRPVGGDTIFEIGSVTKVVTSLILADMVSRKEVRLDDPAAAYLPAGATLPERNGKAITLFDLSTHSSGLPALPDNLKPADPRNPYAGYSVDDLHAFLSAYKLPRDPGTEFEYSNLGAGLLGHVLALRAGMEYEQLVNERVTEPLGMADTAIRLSPVQQRCMATGHNAMLRPTSNWDLPALAGAGALKSTASDLLTLLDAFLGRAPSPLASATTATFDTRRLVGKITVGLGWMISSIHDREIAAHDGGTGGFCAFIGCDRQAGTGVVVLSNASTRGGVFDIGTHLLDPQWPLAAIEAPRVRTEVKIDPGLLDRYTGVYQVTPVLALEITRDGDRLFAQALVQTTRGPKFELFPESETAFFAKVSDKQVVFGGGPGGRVTELVLHAAGRPPLTGARIT